MSWALLVMPLHVAAADGALGWAADAGSSFALPEEPSAAHECNPWATSRNMSTSPG